MEDSTRSRAIARGGFSEVRSHVPAVSEDVVRLKEEVGERTSTGDVRSLADEVFRLKEGEWSLGDRISDVEEKDTEAERVLRGVSRSRDLTRQ